MEKNGENIFMAYKKAAEAVEKLDFWQDKMTAWQMVADFCRDKDNCALENKPARDTVLFWTYNNMAALAAENNPDISLAVEYYQDSLTWAQRPYDRIVVYRKIADLYKQAGEVSAWLDTVKKIIQNEEDIAEITALIELARQSSNPTVKKSYLKKAWARAECSSAAEGRECRMISELLDGAAREMRTSRYQRPSYPGPDYERRV